MPAIVGNVKIVSVGSSGVVQFGDAFILSPNSTSKTFAGAGSFSTGDFQNSTSGFSATNTYDKDAIDSSVHDAGVT